MGQCTTSFIVSQAHQAVQLHHILKYVQAAAGTSYIYTATYFLMHPIAAVIQSMHSDHSHSSCFVCKVQVRWSNALGYSPSSFVGVNLGNTVLCPILGLSPVARLREVVKLSRRRCYTRGSSALASSHVQCVILRMAEALFLSLALFGLGEQSRQGYVLIHRYLMS